jgi:hypothetical protein
MEIVLESKRHKEKWVEGLGAWVDEKIVPLVLVLNRIDGVRTSFSCQGGGANVFDAYVSFDLRPAVAGAFFTAFFEFSKRGEKAWESRHRHRCRGCKHWTPTLQINGRRVRLSWQPWDYPALLAGIRGIARKMQACQ